MKEKLSLWERFRAWAWMTPPSRQVEHPTVGDYLLAKKKARVRNSALSLRRARNRIHNRMAKLSRRINWGLK